MSFDKFNGVFKVVFKSAAFIKRIPGDYAIRVLVQALPVMYDYSYMYSWWRLQLKTQIAWVHCWQEVYPEW